MIVAGLDIGSTTTKCVLLREEGAVGAEIVPTGVDPAGAGMDALMRACRAAGVRQEEIGLVATTGYGRRISGLGELVLTEIKACAVGMRRAAGEAEAGCVVDVGGQDTKVIRLAADGEVEDFAMNDKCAAGTGRFLEVLADKLRLSYKGFVAAALRSDTTLEMNATCAVFAESEVVSLLAHGTSKEDIAAAAHRAISRRIASMIERVGRKAPFWLVGGGALNGALVRALAGVLGAAVRVPERPQFVVALGAALCAWERRERRGDR